MLCYSVTRIGKGVQEQLKRQFGSQFGTGVSGFFAKQKAGNPRPQMAPNSLLTIM